jgi:hypothetical protein
MERFKAGDIIKAKMAYLRGGNPVADFKYFLIVSKRKHATDVDQDYSAYRITSNTERNSKYDMEFDQTNINLSLPSVIRTDKQHSIDPRDIVGYNYRRNQKGTLVGSVTKDELRKARRLHESEQEPVPIVTMKVKHKKRKKKEARNQTLQEIMDELFLAGLK